MKKSRNLQVNSIDNPDDTGIDGGHLHRLVSYALTIPLVTVATFVANRTWAFAPPDIARQLSNLETPA